MWVPVGKALDESSLGSLAPTEVLYEFEGEPLTFVAQDSDGASLLVHNLCVFERTSRYLVSAIDERVLQDLKAGRIDIRAGLRQPRCWIADVGEDALVKSLWRVEFAAVPANSLPRPGAMVNPALDPLFRLRLVGSDVGPGKTSAADIRMAAEAAETGLRGLARVALDAKKRVGQVPRDVRHYSDLPYQYSLAASFEIAFGRPRDNLLKMDEEVFDEMGRLLAKGLNTLRASGAETAPLEGLNEDQSLQLFEAIKALTPPTRGGVDHVELGGGLVDIVSGSKVLTRDDRVRSNRRIQRIKAARKAFRKEAPFRVMGVIEEMDQGTSSFTLRQLDPTDAPSLGAVAELPFRFEDHLYDAVMDAFTSLERVAVVGERVDSIYQALDVQELGELFVGDSDAQGPSSE